jgi:hypothetical protein
MIAASMVRAAWGQNTLLFLKQWRGIVTRHRRNSSSFLAAAQARCLALWRKIL